MAQRDDKGRFVRTTPDYKAMYESKCEEVKTLNKKMSDMTIEYANAAGEIENKNYRIAFLYEHSPFWAKWKYNREFKKG